MRSSNAPSTIIIMTDGYSVIIRLILININPAASFESVNSSTASSCLLLTHPYIEATLTGLEDSPADSSLQGTLIATTKTMSLSHSQSKTKQQSSPGITHLPRKS